ncbi:MAG: ABC transporter substrate-binding protein [Gammaproteobacteria bacterium]|jgi:phospholipid transport system substrate-binding protein
MNLICSLLLTVALTLWQPAFAVPQSESAEDTVNNLHAELLLAMQLPEKTSVAKRIETLKPVIEASFDFTTIAKIILGDSWPTLSNEQRSLFQDTLQRLSVATYADHFSKFSGEKFLVTKVNDKKQLTIVDTRLIPVNGSVDDKSISMRYLLTRKDDRWQIINVIAQGVSDLALKQAEYAYVIKKDGFKGLVSQLNDKIVNLQ